MMRDHSGAIWSDPMRGNYPKEYDLEKVSSLNIPTNIIVGAEDRIFLPLARQLHELIPNSKLNEFENIGHLVNLESPEKFRVVVKEFLKKCC